MQNLPIIWKMVIGDACSKNGVGNVSPWFPGASAFMHRSTVDPAVQKKARLVRVSLDKIMLSEAD